MPLLKTRKPVAPPPKHTQGLIPPCLAQQLTRFAFRDDPFFVLDLAPCYSLECELLYRSVPRELWQSKSKEELRLRKSIKSIKDRLGQRGIAQGQLTGMLQELQEELWSLRMGFTALVAVRQAFFRWIDDQGLLCEYAYQALEEYAEGPAGGLLPYWPAAARRSWSEGALVSADWVLERFECERTASGSLPLPRLAFLNSDDPEWFTPERPPPIIAIFPRNPASRIVGLPPSASSNSPPAYSPHRDLDGPHETATSPNSSFSKAHSSDSGHGDLIDLIDLDDDRQDAQSDL